MPRGRQAARPGATQSGLAVARHGTTRGRRLPSRPVHCSSSVDKSVQQIDRVRTVRRSWRTDDRRAFGSDGRSAPLESARGLSTLAARRPTPGCDRDADCRSLPARAGARTDDAHVPAQHVPESRQLVDRRRSQGPADATGTGVGQPCDDRTAVVHGVGTLGRSGAPSTTVVRSSSIRKRTSLRPRRTSDRSTGPRELIFTAMTAAAKSGVVNSSTTAAVTTSNRRFANWRERPGTTDSRNARLVADRSTKACHPPSRSSPKCRPASSHRNTAITWRSTALVSCFGQDALEPPHVRAAKSLVGDLRRRARRAMNTTRGSCAAEGGGAP